MAIRLMGQVFDRMSKLVKFSGDEEFWNLLTPEFKQSYANACRRSPNEVFFELEKWIGSEEIQAAVAEYKAEKAMEDADPSNAVLEY